MDQTLTKECQPCFASCPIVGIGKSDPAIPTVDNPWDAVKGWIREGNHGARIRPAGCRFPRDLADRARGILWKAPDCNPADKSRRSAFVTRFSCTPHKGIAETRPSSWRSRPFFLSETMAIVPYP